MENSHTKLTILGGNNNNHIGASAQLLEHTNEKGHITRIMIDLGSLLISEERRNGHLVADATKYLGYNPPKNQISQTLKNYHKSVGGQKSPQIEALFLTHMHEDHIGGIKLLLKAGYIFPPIYGSKETLSVLMRLLIEDGITNLPDVYPINDTLQISKDVSITPFPVSHTTVGSLGYHILTKFNGSPDTGILHLGDFNLSDIMIGNGYNEALFQNFLNAFYVTHVLTDSTSTQNNTIKPLTFKKSVSNWSELMQSTDKRIITAVISRSIQNMAPIIKAATQSGRKVFIDGHAQRLIYDELQKAGVLEDFSATVFHHTDVINADLKQFLTTEQRKNQVIIFSGAFAEGFDEKTDNLSGLVRISKRSLKSFLLDSSSLIALSQRAIPVSDIYENMKDMVQLLAEQNNGQIIQNKTHPSASLGDYPMMELQRTGHATLNETLTLLKNIKKHRLNSEDELTVIPLHGNINQLKQTQKCALVLNINSALLSNNESIILPQNTLIKTSDPSSKTNWLYFKNENGISNGSQIEVVKENLNQSRYETVSFLNIPANFISKHQNKTTLLNIMRSKLSRQMD